MKKIIISVFLLALVIEASFCISSESKISDDPNDVDYILYTRRGSPFNFKIADVNAQELLEHGFDPTKLTKIITHGWVQSGEEYCQERSY